MTTKKIRSVVVASDIHVPYHCQKTTRAWLRFLRDFQPDELVLNGDIADMHAASSHGDSFSQQLIQDEVLAVNDFLDDVRDAVGDRCKIHFCMGNHETRLTRYIEQNAPNLRGMMTPEEAFRLKQRRIGVTQYGKVHMLSDKLGVTHGTFCGTHYARETLVKYGVSLVVGHAHRPQTHTMGVAGEHADAARGCFGLGCMVPVDDVPYMKGPSGWTNGFGVFYIMPDGTFTPYPVLMARQQFVWNGKVYHGRPSWK